MLARLCGWNEPEQVKHDHVHLQVDSAALIEQQQLIAIHRGDHFSPPPAVSTCRSFVARSMLTIWDGPPSGPRVVTSASW